MKSRWSIAFLMLCILVAIILYFHTFNRSKAEAVYTDDHIHMQLLTVQTQSQTMKETNFQIHITELPNLPLTNAEVELNITMPYMFCGVFPAVIIESQPGIYHATAIPVMSGLWQAEAILRLKDRQVIVSALFEVR